MRKKLAIIGTLCAMFCLTIASQQVIESVRYALSLCAGLIIPALFPFFVVTMLLGRLGFPELVSRRLSRVGKNFFNISGAGLSALLAGLIGGYPLGAVYIAEICQSGCIDSDEAERLLCFCNNSGPAFIIGAVGGGLFNSASAGLILYAIHIISALLTGMIFKDKTPCSSTSSPHLNQLPFSALFALTVKQAVYSVLSVCGFVLCFTVFVGLLDTTGFFSTVAAFLAAYLGVEPEWMRALLTGIFELGGGIGAMQGFTLTPMNFSLASAMVGFGGVSVYFQTMAVLADTKIKGTLHFAGRLINALFSFVLSFTAAMLFY